MKSKLGQNFLKNKSKLEKIAGSLDIKEGNVVVEIGPGHGELTDQLLEKGREKLKKLILIEKDKNLAKDLKNKFRKNEIIEILEGDALEILPDLTKKLETKSYKIIGNIPYYITGYLLRVFEEIENKPEFIVLTIQKEVAERIIAKPPKMNLLAASVQFWADAEILDYISKKDFDPVPEVDSAVIALRPRNYAESNTIVEKRRKFYEFIKILFKQPRKTIQNNLRLITDPLRKSSSEASNQQLLIEKLEVLGIKPSDRPQNLSLDQIKKLSEIF